MSDDSRRLQQRQPQQQPPPLAAAFASLSSAVSEARRSMASSLRPPTPPSAAAAATMSAASAASAPLVAAAAARGALKTPATGEKMAVDLAKAAALLAGALAHHASRAAEAAAGALEGGKRRRGGGGGKRGGSGDSASSSSPSSSSSFFSGGGDGASSAALRGVPPPSSRAVASLLAEGAARERALDLRGAISKYEAAVAAARPGLDARALGAASKAWSDASYLDELGVEALSDADKRALNARAIDRCREAALAAPESGLPHAACCVSMGRMALWTPDSRGKARLAAAAREQASLATAKSPESDLAHHLLGRWHWEMAGLPRVVRAIAKLAFGASLPAGTYEDAAACYAKAASLAPRRLVHRVELGRSLARAGRFAEAERQLEAALALEVEDVNAHLQRADAEIMLAALRYDDTAGGVSAPSSSAGSGSSGFPSGYSSAATRAKAWQGSLSPENLAAAALAAGVRDARRSAEEASAAAASASHAGGGSEGDLLRWLGVPPPMPAAFGMGKGATQGARKRPSGGGGGVGRQQQPQQQRDRARGEKERRPSGREEWWQRTPLGRLQQQLLQQLQQQERQKQQPRRRGHHHHHHHHHKRGGAGTEKTPPAVPG